MDHIKSQLDRLADLTDEQISELQSQIVTEFEQIADERTPQSVDTMTALADMLDTVKGEVSRREAQAEELESAAAAAINRIKGEEIVEDVVGDDPIPEQTESEEFPETPEVEEEIEDEEKKKVASAAVDTASEFATTETETEATEAAVSEEVATVEAPAETEAAAEETTSEEAPVEEEAPETEAASDETVTEEVAPETEASAEVTTEAEASTTEETTSEQIAQEEAQTVTASAEGTFEAPADRRPVAEVAQAPVAITAGADIQGIAAGSKFDNMKGVAKAFETRLRSVRHVSGGDGEQLVVASIRTEYPDERILDTDVVANNEKISSVVSREALTASGGFAAPLNVAYDIPENPASDARPVRDALPRFQADRGGIRFFTAPQLGSYANAVGIWTNADDIAAAGRYDGNVGTPDGPVKNTLVVGGATTQEEYTYAVTLQLQFGNFQTRSFPELIARHNELALVQHARQAELALLSKLASKSTAVTAGSTLGFARDFISQVRRAAVQYRSRNRIDNAVNLRAIVPTWIMDAVAADLVMQMPGDNTLAVGRDEIAGFLRASNVTITESLDQNQFGAQAAGALLDWPASFTWFLFPEGTFVFLDGGTLDLGIIRDSGLVATNDYKMFTETFEGLAKVGGEALAITSTVRVNGAAAALQDTVTP